jgi:hypothetical protein
VAKTISMPTTPNFIRSRFTLQRAVGTVASPYTGKIRTQEFDGVFWQAEVSLPPMRRSQAVNWQSFLLELNGTVNNFRFADPDALNKTGTYSVASLISKSRVNETSIELDFSSTNNSITAPSNTTPFANSIVGDFIFVTGATNSANNGTHKITTKTNAYTIIVDPVDTNSLVTEADVTGCTIKDNVKGSKGLVFEAPTNAASGTILKGDYLGISASTTDAASSYEPIQYVMATENATETDNGGSAKNTYSVRTEPKLRSAITDNHRVYINPAKGLFRLIQKDINWDADQISNYGISFSCVEVV